MHRATIDALYQRLTRRLDGEVIDREEVRVWELSGVERLHLAGGGTVIFKYAEQPFADEARVLRHVTGHELPVPDVLAATHSSGALGMLLTDLGPATREPTIVEAVTA